MNPNPLRFGSQPVGGRSTPQTITIGNGGGTDLVIGSMASNSAAFTLANPPAFPLSIAPRQFVAVQVVFNPSSPGPASGTLTVANSQGLPDGTLTLTGTAVPQGAGTHLIMTTGLHAGFLGQPYRAVLSASGGTGPYTWVADPDKPLPAGLDMSAEGVITGVPTQAGSFSLGIAVHDSSTPNQTDNAVFSLRIGAAILDAYRGATEQPCPAGATAHFTTANINGRWWLCTPAGNAFWMRGVYHADASDSGADSQGIELNGAACLPLLSAIVSTPCSVTVRKYGDVSVIWGPQTVIRLKAWGFNTAAEYASLYVLPTTTNPGWNTPDHSNPEKIPFTGMIWPAHYARNLNAYANPVKDLVAPIASSTYAGYRHPMPDVFDPNFALWLQKDLADPATTEYNWIHSPHSDYLVGLNVDDTDELMGFGAGPDFPTITNGKPDSGTGRAEPHLGWVVLTTPPTQVMGKDANGNPIAYADPTVYSKLELARWLSARYNGSIAALNAAWGASYASFGSDGGWGAGSGLLDEDGTHSWVPRDPYRLAGASPAMAQDLNDFLEHFAAHYFSVIKQALASAAPGILYLGPTSLGAWGAPPRKEILQAASQYVDVLGIPSIPTGCATCGDDQARIDFLRQYGGAKPWIAWEGFMAQPDSAMSAFAAPNTSMPYSATQAARGQQFASMVTQLLQAHDSASGNYPIVGYKWWELYDNRGEQANWGLLTRRDNAYDGSAVTATGMDSWGYGTGGEQSDYGDFLSAVVNANLNTYKVLLGLP